MLRDLNLKCIYDSSEHNLIQDLIVPLLRNSVRYYRGVGFFSSSWLRLASEGLLDLIKNGGEGKIVMSPVLSEDDWKAFKIGDDASRDTILKKSLEVEIDNLLETMQKNTLTALAWMISDRVLEFRFAVPMGVGFCDYHDKVGVFIDEDGDKVAIHGSFNDSLKASMNGEAFSVFKSWEPGQVEYVDRHFARLDQLMKEGNSQFKTLSIPNAVREKIVRLRDYERPYKLKDESLSVSVDEFKPHCPKELFSYQNDAIQKWIAAGYIGIFEMATGTGKTVTSLAAAVSVFQSKNRLALLIVVPYLHLVKQWEAVCASFGFVSINCCSEYKGWQMKATLKIQDFNIGGVNDACFIAVNQTASTQEFIRIFDGIREDSLLIIADEVHYLGSKKLRNVLNIKAGFRIGLSATPDRWFDADGTDCINQYFKGTCFELPLSEAIGKYLTPYEYQPVVVHLSDSEAQKYESLTQKIRKMWLYSSAREDLDENENLKNALIERSRVIAGAAEKLEQLKKHLLSEIALEKANGNVLKNTLVYAAPGRHRDVIKMISDLGIRCHEFVHEVSVPEREELLARFSKGEIQVLVAIKCLDEGVDVPATERAYFLASTTNPKEFIQRRGRVLRKCVGKEKAKIIDFIVLPDLDAGSLGNDSAMSLLKREIARFGEFARESLNMFAARKEVFDTLNQLGVVDLLDKEPWEIYGAAQTNDVKESEIMLGVES